LAGLVTELRACPGDALAILDEAESRAPSLEEVKAALPAQVCPYDLPVGVRLVRYTPKKPPIAVTVCSVVTDPDKFIRHTLGELEARLHHALQIRAGDSVFEILSKLSDCGLELRLLSGAKMTGFDQ
jgi:hypothetical protein